MPQISQIGEIYSSQLFWLVITFGLTFFIVGLGMLPKIQSTVDARQSRIAADLAKAEEARETADKLEEEYRHALDQARGESMRLVSEAKADAGRRTEQRLAETNEGIDARVEEAQKRIAEARQAALVELEEVAADATRQMIERVSNVQVEPEAARAAVQREMAHG